MTDCIESKILDALDKKLKELTWVKLVSTDYIRLGSSDFMEHELPAIQVYDLGTTVTQQHGHTQNSWLLAVELIMKPSENGLVSNRTVLNYRREIIDKLGEDPRLVAPDVAGMLHIQYNDCVNDPHLLAPLYMARLTWEVQYLAPFAPTC